VFVSSHILSEVQHTADRVAILARGRCVKAGPVGEVLAGGRVETLLVCLDDLERGRQVLAKAGIEAVFDGPRLRVAIPAPGASTITRILAEEGLFVSELRPDEADLERVFLELTKDAVS
jgi:ABC-2 type transport system ATP-binding protein